MTAFIVYLFQTKMLIQVGYRSFLTCRYLRERVVPIEDGSPNSTKS